jgi:hypothetical protein
MRIHAGHEPTLPIEPDFGKRPRILPSRAPQVVESTLSAPPQTYFGIQLGRDPVVPSLPHQSSIPIAPSQPVSRSAHPSSEFALHVDKDWETTFGMYADLVELGAALVRKIDYKTYVAENWNSVENEIVVSNGVRTRDLRTY